MLLLRHCGFVMDIIVLCLVHVCLHLGVGTAIGGVFAMSMCCYGGGRYHGHHH